MGKERSEGKSKSKQINQRQIYMEREERIGALRSCQLQRSLSFHGSGARGSPNRSVGSLCPITIWLSSALITN